MPKVCACWLALFTTIAIASANANATGLSDEQEQQIIRHVLAVDASPASSHFVKWTRDTAVNYALSCLHSDKETLEKKLSRLGFDSQQQQKLLNTPPLHTGTFNLDNDSQMSKACQLIAENGIAPLCITGTVLSDARSAAPTKLPLEYAIISSKKPTSVSLTLQCSISHHSDTSTDGITTTQGVYSQFYVLTQDDVKRIDGQGLAAHEWNDPFSLMLTAAGSSGTNGNLVVNTILQKDAFIWTLAIVP